MIVKSKAVSTKDPTNVNGFGFVHNQTGQTAWISALASEPLPAQAGEEKLGCRGFEHGACP